MKKIFLIGCLCLSSMLGMAQYGTQFENRGFESWANFGSNNNTNEPTHWHSTKSASGTFSGFLSQQIEPSSVVRPGSSGTKSVRMWPVSVMGVTANGNLTNGRMNAGSMSATGSGNYNYTQRSDERFNTPIRSLPDSLTVWVCFRSASSDQEAEARAAIHGDADFKFVSNGTVDPANQLVATARKRFTRTATSGGNYTWKRLSIPFVKDGPCNDPRYILFTITTNKTPGEGGTSDDLFVDDILLVYNPSIQMGAILKNQFEIGEELVIPFTLTGTMSPENLNSGANQVIAQLSAANGSFSNPIELGRVTTNTSGNLTVTLPHGIFAGQHYRIRLVTTNYPMVSEDNGFDISISTNNAVAEASNVSLTIYPNPAHDVIHLSSEKTINNVEIFNFNGKLVLTEQCDSNDIEFSLNDMASGIYLAKCYFNHQYATQTFYYYK